ncbi:23S rRNA (cytidine1920-2'-O)/16S rRNA (cytidine1409-2'-O)-methyltransferase [Croceifilum oryzae]|uniref:23S rRNA (Cytidine1920-2'-O)/16S rRNA (Cytidine1409-2'-O)-methyltransferase n=1 Tax=Croceifilum oryzae TaxID=1553429 RepID=A0AAJ1THM7_9BACL|nr:TlyA family RNA methyltransferase [Croceifilum oryzae]MDQ0418659.1 23S rRNA (cytidine1920-2'-O)/16S rRNA (cytidine1409-2'-O)-methyltransferase [Croceifilum oryzae]
MKERIDVLLVQQGFYESRQQAQRAIMAGLVLVEQERIDKPGTKVPVDKTITIKGQVSPYVSRGGLKLEKALHVFPTSVQDQVVLDIGASTGGFTDCALQNGAKQVYAIDVGYGQLAWKIREDARVIVMERTNFRYLEKKQLTGELPTYATIDVSFISLSHILPVLGQLLPVGGQTIALVKPQFEAGKEQIGKKGIVKDPKIHEQVLLKFVFTANSNGFSVKGISGSPITGGEGNIEFISLLEKQETPVQEDWTASISKIVQEVHQRFS